MVSIIVPVVNEAEQINRLISHIRSIDCDHQCQLIVVDGHPSGNTIENITNENVITIKAPIGRASQMNAGAKIADGDILLFLHADTYLPENACTCIEQTLADGRYVAGAFDLGIDSGRLSLKLIAMMARIRSRLLRTPYGDQAIFIKKDYFEQIGGYCDMPVMEDVDLARRIKKSGGHVRILSERVSTSPRRWEKEGVIYTTMRNWAVIVMYYLGVKPEKLASFYRRHR